MTSRVIQWGTGNVGRHALRAILGRPNLELVGLRVYNPEKGGKDAGQRVRMVFLEKWISLGLVQKRKKPLRNHEPRGGASVAALEERHRV